MIKLEDISFSYSPETSTIIDHLTLSIEAGEYVAIVGPNGSGKSTLARLMNGLLTPTNGKVQIGDLDTSKDDDLWSIRQRVGMVFQNPENQFVATTVLDDVAFGLENIGYPPQAMEDRIKESLDIVQMWEHRLTEPHHLSGGQKQRVAIAGILAIEPQIIIFDESTSMLDPEGRSHVRHMMQKLNKEGLTVIMITHDMVEAAEASRVVVMAEGAIVRDGLPADVFKDVEFLEKHQLELPFTLEVGEKLRHYGLPIPCSIQNQEELVKHLWTLS